MKFTIRQLRRAGFKVRVIHTRHYETINEGRMSGPYRRLSGKGGETKIQITTPDKHITVEGVAVCSKEDGFNRKLGNSIALGRAIEKFREHFPNVVDILNKI